MSHVTHLLLLVLLYCTIRVPHRGVAAPSTPIYLIQFPKVAAPVIILFLPPHLIVPRLVPT